MPLALVFFILLLLSFTTLSLLSRPRAADRTLRRRLEVIRVQPRDDSGEAAPLAPAAPRRQWMERLGSVFDRFRFGAHLKTLIRHAGSSSPVGAIVITSVLLGSAAAVLARGLALPLPLVVMLALAAIAAPYGRLRFQRGRRLKKFTQALPDAIDLMARALRAGHSMASAIEIIAEQSPQPLAAEFATCFQQQKFGIPFRDALLAMGERIPSRDLHFLITAVLVQKETGGDLTEILDRTTVVIRERVRIEGEIRTYTAQGRLTGWILSCLPVAMLTLINIITPGYSHILFYDPLGQKLLYAGAGCIALGGFTIRRIVDIKV